MVFLRTRAAPSNAYSNPRAVIDTAMEKIRALLSSDCFIWIFYFFSSFRMSAVTAFLGFTNRGLLGNPLGIRSVLIAQQSQHHRRL
jgi:hypothetical protein